jgi:hypothetical protein
MISAPHQIRTGYYSGDKIKENEMAGHVALWGRENMHTWFWWGNPRERYHLEDLGLIWVDNIKMDL